MEAKKSKGIREVDTKEHSKLFDSLLRKDERESESESFIARVKRTAAVLGIASMLYFTPNLNAQSGPLSSVDITWDDPDGRGVAYNLLRSQKDGGPFTLITPAPVEAMAYTDTNVQRCQIYYYAVIAINAQGVPSTRSAEAVIPGTTNTAILVPCRQPDLNLPTDVYPPSSSSGNTTVNITGTGFSPNAQIKFGYIPIPPDTDVVIDTSTDAKGNWLGSFHAPWSPGSYNVEAIDANGFFALGTLLVTTQQPTLKLPTKVSPPSSSSGNTKVSVTGAGFTPNTPIEFGYSPIPPYGNVLVNTISDAKGNWSGSFSAPWSTGSYKMIVIDTNGLSATGTLVVTTN